MSENTAILLVIGLGLIAAGTILYFRNEKLKPWAAGHLLCLACGKEHVGTWLIGSEPLECPFCGEVMCVPHDGVGFGDAQELSRQMERVS